MANGSFHMSRAAINEKMEAAGVQPTSSQKAGLFDKGANWREVRSAMFKDVGKREKRRKALRKMAPLFGGRFAGAKIGLQGSEG